MPVLITTDSGRSVDVADPANAQLVADSFDRLLKRATDAEAKVCQAQESADKAQAAADAANEKLEEARKASGDEAIAARVKAISTTQELARKVAGDGFTCDSLDVTEIKRAAMVVARPKVAWGDKSAAYVEAAFDAESEKDEEEEDGDKGDKKPTGDAAVLLAQLAQLAKDGATTVTTVDAKPSAYQQHKQNLANAHKSKGA